MLSLLERSIARIPERLVLLAPPDRTVPTSFLNVTTDASHWHDLMSAMQRLRGGVYLSDGAVRPDQLSSDGLHQTPEDERSWHLLMLNKDRRVSSCVWYLEHEASTSINELRVRNCPLTKDKAWSASLKNAIRSELARAGQDGLRYAELGGWAVSKESRCTAEGLLLALGAYSLGRFFGGALGITTATVRHGSSTILRRLGGSRLEFEGVVVPTYYDAKYECDMELLRFDSRATNPKYDGLVDSLKARLADVQVIATPARAFEIPEPTVAVA